MQIGVTFCGNCNPHVQVSAVLKGLAGHLPSVEFVPWRSRVDDRLLVLCGCPNGGAAPPPTAGRTVVVTSQSVDHWPLAELDLVRKVPDALEGP